MKPIKLFIRNKYINVKFVGLIVLSIGLITLNHQQTHLKTFRWFLAELVAPAQYIINWPVKIYTWADESLSENQSLLVKNKNLQGEVIQLKARLQKLILLERENTQLRALLHSSPRENEKMLVAQLLAVDPDPFAQQVILNQGKNAQVYLGQPVLDGNGVFGQIIQVEPFTSRVLLLTDTRSAIPVQDVRSGTRGIVVGLGDSNKLKLIDMPVTADLKIGDALVTSGLGEKFPVGYPVGTITSITKNSGNQFATVTVMPAAKINQSHLVLLVWPENINILNKQRASIKDEVHAG